MDGSGSAKSAAYIKPNILQMLGSYVITDPKGELYRETSGFLKANGYKIKTLNLVNPEFSDRYNPLAHVKDHTDVDDIAATIIEGKVKVILQIHSGIIQLKCYLKLVFTM